MTFATARAGRLPPWACGLLLTVLSSLMAACGGSGSGAGSGSGPTPQVEADAAATYTPVPSHTLSVQVQGQGSVAAAGRLSCDAACTAALPEQQAVALHATAAAGWHFTGWTGACSGSTTPCSLTPVADAALQATFAPDTVDSSCDIARSTTTTATVASTHPKVLLNHAATLTCLQAQATHNTAAWRRFKAWVDSELAGGVSQDTEYGFEAWHAALVWRITGDSRYRDFAVARAERQVQAEEALIAAGERASVANDSYLYAGGVINSLALVYDWCFDALGSSQRSRWIAYINQTVSNIWHPDTAQWGGRTFAWSGWGTTDPYNNYHYSFLRATMAAGLATAGDNPSAATWRQTFNDRIATLVAAFNGTVPDGGSLEGTNYGVSLKTLFELYDVWERSTGQRLADQSPHTLASQAWMLHQLSPDGLWLASLGDQARYSTAPAFDYNREFMLKLIALYPQAALSGAAQAWLAASPLPTMAYNFESVWDLLYPPRHLPATTLAALPTAHFGRGHGDLFVRGAWGDPQAAYGVFQCGELSESHQHHEEGAFQIYREAWLAPTGNRFTHSGLQAGVSSHNQLWFQTAAGQEVPQTGDCNLQALADNGDYTYALARLTPSYSGQAAVVSHERAFVFIKPATFIVFDRAQANAASVKRVWSVHLAQAPALVQGNHLRYASDGGQRLDIWRTAPANLPWTVQAESWAADDLASWDFPAPRRADAIDGGSGTQSAFLHVIGTSGSDGHSSVLSATDTSSGDTIAARVQLADGRVVKVSFGRTSGGHIEVTTYSGSVLRSEDWPTTVSRPPLLRAQ